jgi:hypothetical protein
VVSAVLLGFAFTGAAINSGIAFGPGFVLLIAVARRTRNARPVPHGEVFTGTGAFLPPRWEAQPTQVSGPRGSEDPVVVVPEAAPVVRIPDAEPRDTVTVSRNGRVVAGPPGVIGLVGPPRQRGGSPGFGRST